MQSYHELDVYKRSVDFVVSVYKITQQFPRSEMFALTDQLKRAVVSIPSNIAEGFDRHTDKDYVHFLQIAYGSSAEVDTQLTIAMKLGYIKESEYKELVELLVIIRKMLHKLIIAVRSRD